MCLKLFKLSKPILIVWYTNASKVTWTIEAYIYFQGASTDASLRALKDRCHLWNLYASRVWPLSAKSCQLGISRGTGINLLHHMRVFLISQFSSASTEVLSEYTHLSIDWSIFWICVYLTWLMGILHVVSPIQFTSEKMRDLHRVVVPAGSRLNDHRLGSIPGPLTTVGQSTPGTQCSLRAICSPTYYHSRHLYWCV